jgi:hypothetical protein
MIQLRYQQPSLWGGFWAEEVADLWEPWMREDVFAIQEELVQSVVGLLHLKMPSARASAPSFRNPVMNGLRSVITFGDES